MQDLLRTSPTCAAGKRAVLLFCVSAAGEQVAEGRKLAVVFSGNMDFLHLAMGWRHKDAVASDPALRGHSRVPGGLSGNRGQAGG